MDSKEYTICPTELYYVLSLMQHTQITETYRDGASARQRAQACAARHCVVCESKCIF